MRRTSADTSGAPAAGAPAAGGSGMGTSGDIGVVAGDGIGGSTGGTATFGISGIGTGVVSSSRSHNCQPSGGSGHAGSGFQPGGGTHPAGGCGQSGGGLNLTTDPFAARHGLCQPARGRTATSTTRPPDDPTSPSARRCLLYTSDAA